MGSKLHSVLGYTFHCDYALWVCLCVTFSAFLGSKVFSEKGV